MVRNSIKLFEDQYNFYKDTKSKRLLVAFVEYMFEDKEPIDLKWLEKTIFDSLRNRMKNSKKITDWNSRWWKTSHWGWRSRKDSWELEWENKSKTSQKQVGEWKKNNEEEDNISKDILLEEEDDVREDWKKRYLKNVWLKEIEYNKLVELYGKKIIEEYILRLNDYMVRKWRTYTDHYLTILKRLSKDNVKKKSEKEDKPIDSLKPTLSKPKLPWITKLKKDC